MGCGDRYGNKMPTGNTKVFLLSGYLLKTEKESVWKGVKSGGIVGAGVTETSADSTRADGNEQL